ncbi:MAG: hypothetical protein R2780_10685 [Crocinitomicaceae bacterium]|nr:hypothetical protein [Crocinitomicaceae bacterium]
MDKQTKNVLIVIGAIVVLAIVLKLVFTYWWTFIIGALAFGIGYAMGRNKKK